MVAGVRYFQTEDKRGVFIRPAKLEQDLPSTTSPIPKSTSRTSISEAPLPSPTEKSLKVGEHVIYNGKTGIVRFVGPTDFKDGVWVGIELHEPSGKNDGSVLGKYYFNCPPKFGLFAMPHKVQRIKKIPGSPSIGTRSIRGIYMVFIIRWRVEYTFIRSYFTRRFGFFIWFNGIDKLSSDCTSAGKYHI